MFHNKNIFLALTYRCNAFCKKCMTRYHTNRNMELSPQLLDRIVDKLRAHQYEGLISVGSGEPLLYPHFSAFFSSVLSVNDAISLRILSNGKGFHAGLPAEYFTPRCKWGITMDAFTQEGLSGFQSGIEISQVKDNLAQVVQRYGPDGLYLNYTLHSRNYRELADFCRFAAELGIKEVYVTELKVYEGYEDRLRAYRLERTPEVQKALSHAAELLERSGISSSGIPVEEPAWRPACFLRGKASPIIDVDGSVSFCAGREEVLIGNILDPDIETVWADLCQTLTAQPEAWCRFCHAKPLENGCYTLPGIIDRGQLLDQLARERSL